MPIIPNTIQDLLTFCDEHEPVWEVAPTTIGLTAGQVTGFKALLTTARANFNAQQTARSAAKAATMTSQSSIAQLRQNLAELLKFIKAYAESQADPSVVYSKAQIPAPQPAGPSVPPAQPTDISATLEPDGAVTLRWKAHGGPSGNTIWTISRKLPGQAAFTFCGASGSRVFSDESLPAGSANAQYMIQGRRGQTVGTSSLPFTVLFGTGGADGATTITAQYTGEDGLKVAA